MSDMVSHARKPWVASALSLVCTGLGQIYCGEVRRGLIMFCSSLMFGPLIVLTAVYADRTPMLVAFFVVLAMLIAVVIWSVRDARAIARRLAHQDFQLKEVNHPAVYGMMVATSLPYVLGLAFFLRTTVIEAFVIPSASMAPTFLPGDRILVTKMGLSTTTFHRGDVVVFRNPVNRQQIFVKRIIGLPGETVEIKNGTVIIDGKPLEKTPAPPAEDNEGKPLYDGATFLERTGDIQHCVQVDKPDEPIKYPPVKVAEDAYFVLGDHRDNSNDSRGIGSVPHGLMVGTVRCIYFPALSWRRFGAPK
jgi:signal peptidase I